VEEEHDSAHIHTDGDSGDWMYGDQGSTNGWLNPTATAPSSDMEHGSQASQDVHQRASDWTPEHGGATNHGVVDDTEWVAARDDDDFQ
jgi:hypothetical protein